MNIGGHVSMAGGLDLAVDRAVAQTFEGFQIFVSPPRSYLPARHAEEKIALFKEKYQQHEMNFLFFHAIYMVNLGTTVEAIREKSLQSLESYLEMGDVLGAKGTIVHAGSISEGTKPVLAAIEELMSRAPSSQPLIIENAASAKRFGGELAHLAEAAKTFSVTSVQVCLDTQHLYAAGVDITNPDVCATWLDQFGTTVGFDRLAVLHVNDSKSAVGSNVDRHENIGEGAIGVAGLTSFFKTLNTFTDVSKLPLILETPGVNRAGPDKKNADALRSIITDALS